MDRMVALAADARPVGPAPVGGYTWRESVGVTVTRALGFRFGLEEDARMPFLDEDDAFPQREPFDAEQVRAWWTRNRESFGFGVPAPWTCVFDEELRMDKSRPYALRLADGQVLTARLVQYRDVRDEAQLPRTVFELKFTREEHGTVEDVYRLDGPYRLDGGFGHGSRTWYDDTVLAFATSLLPTDRATRARIRIRIHVRPVRVPGAARRR
jgi:hypothetical protein